MRVDATLEDEPRAPNSSTQCT